MSKCITVGCDLHDKSMLLKMAVDRGRPWVRSWGTCASDRGAMVAYLLDLSRREGASRILFAYEACGFGFRLHDELREAGIECYVLAPSKMERSVQHRKRKTDERDAQVILDELRSFVLAGVELPSVWVPDVQTRDDRELVRQRLAAAEDAAAVQVRVRWLLKRNGIESVRTKGWSQEVEESLWRLSREGLPSGARAALGSLLRRLDWQWTEIARLDAQVLALSQTARYAAPVRGLSRHKGVGVLTAMVFLTEMGDLSRFTNRREVGAYLGLVPTSHETGEEEDHKGHITHQGPSRVRKVLCQAVWSRLRSLPKERIAYDRIVARNPKHRKIAVVARMRSLGVVLWHEGMRCQIPATELAAVPA